MKEQVMPRCWLAFSALVADGQFAQLGLMLIALLAKASAVLRFPGEEVPKGELESVEEARAVEATTIVLPTEDFGEAITRDDDAEVDVGVSVERLSKKKSKKRHVLDADEGDEEAVDSTLEELVPKKRKMKAVETEVEAKASQPVAKPAKKVKKKKKKGDAFDDLFAGLV